MAMQVCMGAVMQCAFGLAPSSLVVLPLNRTYTDQVPDANIMDHVPMVNIMPFGMCTSLANPDCSSGHCSGDGRTDADAVHPEYARALGCGRADRGARQCPRSG